MDGNVIFFQDSPTINTSKPNKPSYKKTVYTTVVISGLIISGVSVSVQPSSFSTNLITKDKRSATFISSEVDASVYTQTFRTQVIEERDIIDVKEVIDMNLVNKTLHEIKTMKNVGIIVGTLFGGFILSTPMYSNADWVTAVLASLIGFSIPILNVVERKFSR
ncbi:hypothetical protein P7H41_13520 [Vagococcus fluvialis]|uniref:hypothetical protein n=1 Tax=Vagococcus fluvialis TaxID=2738 RepID=UPI00289120DD|nr:hypothetical protein [Vagococcus fluvialis]MDT2782962.1 hypothetical protein [Vagococcus fluvialis]